jgi:hypothetical protein
MNTQDFIKELLENRLDNNTIINFVTEQQAKLDKIKAIVGCGPKHNGKEPLGQKWHLYSHYHWSRTLNGKRLDYWPTKSKFQYDGKIVTGDVYDFISKNTV